MQENSIHSAAKDFIYSVLDPQGAFGKTAIVIKDDKGGSGRKFYKHLRKEISTSGLKVFELSDFQSINGHFIRELGKLSDSHYSEQTGVSLGEQSLFSALQIISLVSRQLGDKPFVLSLQHMARWDGQTALLVNLLLESAHNGSRLVPGKKSGPRSIVLALEGESRDPSTCSAIEEILHHPETIRYSPTENFSIGLPSRAIDSRTIRPLRLCQLAYLPLKVSELKKLEGRNALTSIGRCGVDARIEGSGDEALVHLTDGISPYLGDTSSLPYAQLKEYHSTLLGVFEARNESDSISVARFYHAVKADRVESIFRWFAAAVEVLLEKGKAEEAVVLLKESLLTTTSRQQSFRGEGALRRTLAGIYATSGRPLQACHILYGGDFKKLTIPDWYLLAQTALEAGNVEQSQEAIDTVLNGNYLDEKSLLQFKALQAEIEYMRGNYDSCLRLCRTLQHDTLLERPDKLRLLNTEGKVYLATRRFKKAERIFTSNMKASLPAGLYRQAVVSMINIAVCNIRLGHYPLARKWLEKSLKESRRRHFYREEAISLENIATLYHLERNFQKALEYYSRALDILKHLDCHELLARVANNIGELYIRFGDMKRAREMQDYSKKRLGEIRGSLVEGEGMLLSGRIKFNQANFSDALEEFSKAEVFFTNSSAGHLYVEAVILKAASILRSGLAVDAEAELEKVSCMFEESHGLRAIYLLNKAKILRESSEDPEPLLKEAIREFKALGDREGELESILEIIHFTICQGDRKKAAKLLKKAEVVNNMVRCGVPTDQLENFDRTAPRRKLLAMKRNLKNGKAGKGNTSMGRRAGSSGGNGNNGGGRSVYDIMEDDGSEGEEPSAKAFDNGSTVDLRVLLSEGISLSELKDRVEKQCIEQAMLMSGGNISKAASLLGMKRPRLSQLVKHYKLTGLKKN